MDVERQRSMIFKSANQTAVQTDESGTISNRTQIKCSQSIFGLDYVPNIVIILSIKFLIINCVLKVIVYSCSPLFPHTLTYLNRVPVDTSGCSENRMAYLTCMIEALSTLVTFIKHRSYTVFLLLLDKQVATV